ncbi:hypothetical protein SASPL_116955 [Salvia splendens]|uniref:t-SNARE coiled-coil homology domain-containing protein n=1 Tax=Salvia splendens TaxID=180675 RepID=A0A8X8XUN1_SALSN|nr:hypothetical protein SASPL_116955 [Salvia splendens]
MGLRFTRSSSDVSLESFNKQIQEVEKQVDKLSVLLQNLKEANEESKSVTKASSMKAIRKRMEKDVGEVGKIARGIKLHELIPPNYSQNIANRQKPGCGKGTAIDRSRTNMTKCVSLTKKFRDLVTEFQTLRQRIEEEYREVVERRVITVTGSRPDEETINNLIETGNSEQIFQQAMQESGRGQEIQERHDAVKEIEKKLLDLHQIYLDMTVLVEAQGDILDNIESQVCEERSRPRPVGDDCASECEKTAEELEKMHVLCHYTSLSNRSYYSAQRDPTMEKLTLTLCI